MGGHGFSYAKPVTLLVLVLTASGVFWWLFLLTPEKSPGITPRLQNAVWNLGHLVIFFVWAWIVASFLAHFFRWHGVNLFLVTLFLSFAAGFATEEAQFSGGERSASVDDLVLDTIGAFVALVLHPMCRTGIRRWLRITLQCTCLLLIGYALKPTSFLLIDTYYQLRQFPVLLDFSTPLEMSRVNGSAEFILSSRPDTSDSRLRITFETDKYSAFGFADFPENWRSYDRLTLHLFNESKESLELICRIQDQEHNLRYTDRYNGEFVVEHGLSVLQIDLNLASRSLQGRTMDMAKIDLLLCFTDHLVQPRTLWVDKIELLKSAEQG